jgi:hypothetical protein
MDLLLKQMSYSFKDSYGHHLSVQAHLIIHYHPNHIQFHQFLTQDQYPIHLNRHLFQPQFNLFWLLYHPLLEMEYDFYYYQVYFHLLKRNIILIHFLLIQIKLHFLIYLIFLTARMFQYYPLLILSLLLYLIVIGILIHHFLCLYSIFLLIILIIYSLIDFIQNLFIISLFLHCLF